MMRFVRCLPLANTPLALRYMSGLVAGVVACSVPLTAQTMKAPDITKIPTLYVVLCLAKTPSAVICTVSSLLEMRYDTNSETALRSMSLRFTFAGDLAS